MPSPTTARGLLGLFPRGAYPPATDQRATTPPVRLPTYSSLRSDIGGRGRGKGRVGRGEWSQGPKERWWGERQRRGEEQELNRAAARKVGDSDEYDGREEDDGGAGMRRTGPG